MDGGFSMLFLIIILSAMFLWSLLYIFRLKKDIRSIKGLLRKIKGMDTNMRLTTSTFDKDVAKLTHEMNEILDLQKEIQLESERMNREFRQGITNISHDLRTPLTSASGYIGLIKSDKISDEKKLAYLDVVEGRLNSLASLMNELFDYMQMVEGKVEFELESVDLCHLVREEIASFYNALIQGDFEVRVEIPEQPLLLITAPAQLQRVVQNLVGNVLKHGDRYFKVKVSSDGVMTFTNRVAEVEGLEVEHMFDRFYTSDSSRTSQKTGLGLAITKELIRQLDGTIQAWLEGEFLHVEVQINKNSKKLLHNTTQL